MALSMAVLTLLSGDTLALKEKAKVAGRWIRLSDLLDAARSGPAACELLADVYLGRTPEDGAVRTVTADEIRRELDRRGLDPDAFAIMGDRVEVSRSTESDDPLRGMIAFEIKRHLLEIEPGLRPADVVVRVSDVRPASAPAGFEPVKVLPRGDGWTVTLADPSKQTMDVAVLTRILRTREVSFAVREIPRGKTIEHADLEVRRVDCADEDGYAGGADAVVGAAAATRLRKGAPVALADLRLKPVIRKGDLLRAVATGYEVDARAVEEGAPGQEIAVEIAASKHRVRAKVVAAGRAEVVEGASR